MKGRTMAKKPTATPIAAKQPTFAECKAEFWDDERDRPDSPDPRDMTDYDTRICAEKFIAAARRWLDIQNDKAEAQARAEYASHAAKYLVGLFPNARVNVDAFAMAAGEDLGNYSADIVKLVAEKARRTSKTLPSLAQLLEWCEQESKRRREQLYAYYRAQEEHRNAIERGRRHAKELADKVAGHCTSTAVTAKALAAVYATVTRVPMGLRANGPDAGAIERAMLKASSGDGAAVAVIVDACERVAPDQIRFEELGDILDDDDAARASSDDDFNEYHNLSCILTAHREELLKALAVF